jgi:nitrogen regulatory protein PII
MLLWLLTERLSDGHATVLGAVTGAIAGLATITPCAGYVDGYASIIIGGLAGLICHLALRLKQLVRLDDALDVIAVHFTGGVLGTFLVGFFGDRRINANTANGLFYGGGGRLLGEQALAIVVVVAFSFVLTWIVATGVARTIGLRVLPEQENDLDRVQEGLSAYAFGRSVEVMQPAEADTVGQAMPLARPRGEMRLIRALVDNEDFDELRAILVDGGAVQIVLSEASLYTQQSRREVFRGQRRIVEFDPRLRLEVTAAESDVPRLVRAIQQLPGASSYMQVIDAHLTEAVGRERAPRT